MMGTLFSSQSALEMIVSCIKYLSLSLLLIPIPADVHPDRQQRVAQMHHSLIYTGEIQIGI